MRDKVFSEGLLNTRDAARLLGVRPRTLEHWRSIGTGPTYSKIGRAIRYRREAIEKFIAVNEYMEQREDTIINDSLKYLVTC